MRSADGGGQIEQAGDRQPVVDDHVGAGRAPRPPAPSSGRDRRGRHPPDRRSPQQPRQPPGARFRHLGSGRVNGRSRCRTIARRRRVGWQDAAMTVAGAEPRSPRAERARASIAEALLSLHRRGRPPADGQPDRRAGRHLAAADLPPLRRPRVALPGGVAHPAQAAARALRARCRPTCPSTSGWPPSSTSGPASTSGRRPVRRSAMINEHGSRTLQRGPLVGHDRRAPRVRRRRSPPRSTEIPDDRARGHARRAGHGRGLAGLGRAARLGSHDRAGHRGHGPRHHRAAPGPPHLMPATAGPGRAAHPHRGGRAARRALHDGLPLPAHRPPRRHQARHRVAGRARPTWPGFEARAGSAARPGASPGRPPDRRAAARLRSLAPAHRLGRPGRGAA